MASNYTLDDFARDVAFEVNLGGFRFDPGDVAAVLHGIDRRSLLGFSDRVKYHSRDFAPAGVPFGGSTPEFDAFLEKSVSSFLSEVKTAEDLGLETPAFRFDASACHADLGKYFVFPSGDVAFCRRATREAMWGDVSSELYGPVDGVKACRLLAGSLLGAYGKDAGEGCRSCDFSTSRYVSGGQVLGLRREADGGVCVSLSNFSVPLDQLSAAEGILLFDILSGEVLTRRGEALRPEDPELDPMNARAILGELGSELCMVFGEDVVSDFWYRVVRVDAGQVMFLHRDGGDFRWNAVRVCCEPDSGRLSEFVFLAPEGGDGRGAKALAVPAGELHREAVSDLLPLLSRERMILYGVVDGPGSLVLSDAPEVDVPEESFRMRAERVHLGLDGTLLVSGRRSDGRGDCVMALGNLGDGAVSKVSRAARDELSRKYPLGRDVSLKEFLSSSRSREGREALDRGIRI